MKGQPFLTAHWRYLLMLNYVVDSRVLMPFVPRGTELDFYEGKTFVSIVGFQFLGTKVLGWSIPFHQDFEEVNLRFYIRRHTPEGWRRGVVFIRELVPRWAIAFVARAFYGEPYIALPMRHKIQVGPQQIYAQYEWRRNGDWECLRAEAAGEAQEIANGSVEEFITEHYWGYTARQAICSEYQVEHPRWRVWHAREAALKANVLTLYGEQFLESLSGPSVSAFIAEGSLVAVRKKSELLLDGDEAKETNGHP